MKKLILFLLPLLALAQNPTNFPYGIKNPAATSDSAPAYFTTTQVDGVHKKTPAALVAKVAIVNDSLATKENVANKSDSYTTISSTTYVSSKALVDGLASINEYVTPEQFGAIGDGISDDTSEVQAALSTTSKKIMFRSGKTYLIDGGLTSSVSDRIILAYGATIKLKNSATVKGMMSITGTNTKILGGIWDGNKSNGNSTGSGYGSYNIAILANNCTVENITSINTFGIGIKGGGSVSYMLCKNNNIKDTEYYGIFIDSNGTVNQIGNKAIGNTIDCSSNPLAGQGILFTSILASGFYQTQWEISNNNVTGSSIATTAQAICLAVRGHNGVFSNNTTKYGSMGISEGGDNTIYSNNIISDCPTASASYGIELTGSGTVVSGNVINNVNYGILGSNYTNYDNTTIIGNRIKALSGKRGIYLQIAIGYTGKNINISNNSISAKICIYTVRDVSGLVISGNILTGEGAAVSNGRGVFLDTPLVGGIVSLFCNKISEIERGFSVYSLSSATYTNLFAIGNDLSKNVNSASGGWTFEGLSVAGNSVSSAWGVDNSGNRKHIIDQSKNTFILFSDNYNNPEGLLTAGIGSIFYSLNGSGGAYYKNTGTGNTGWRSILDITASPSFTGTPTAPTATAGTNTTQIATTAFVLANSTASSGTFTPAAVGAITFDRCYWIKNGNVLDVVYNFSITGNTSYSATMTLPNSFTINANSNGREIGGGKITTNSGYSRVQETATSSDIFLSIVSENTGAASGFARASVLIN